jgi:hypothetical protein
LGGNDLEGAPPRGLEPPTFSLGNCCSIQLSYGGEVVLQYLAAGTSRKVSRLVSAVVSNGRGDRVPEGGQPIAEHGLVLLEAVLHHLRAVADDAQVGVHLLHHILRGVAHLAAHGVEAHRRPARISPEASTEAQTSGT